MKGAYHMPLAFSKALVTGGAGFIGSHLVTTMLEQGCNVTVLDNLSSGHMHNLEQVRDRIRFIKGDIQDLDGLSDAMSGCEVVFHQAAVVSVTKTVEDPLASTMVNDLGTLKVLETARLKNVERVVLASSSAVYGDDPQSPKNESMRPKPLSPYAVQKLTNEYYAGVYHQLFGLQTVCLRYFNVYGPRQDPSSPYSGVISIFMSRAVQDKEPIIYGDGHQTRDFIYVQDVVQANLLAAQQKHISGEIFNVGTNKSIDINLLWESIAALGGCSQKAHYAPPRPGDIVESLADIQKAQAQLGFQPAFNLQTGLEKTFSWYKQGV
jgi:nucleoside-diphosphate-sugar epimerase